MLCKVGKFRFKLSKLWENPFTINPYWSPHVMVFQKKLNMFFSSFVAFSS